MEVTFGPRVGNMIVWLSLIIGMLLVAQITLKLFLISYIKHFTVQFNLSTHYIRCYPSSILSKKKQLNSLIFLIIFMKG